MTVMVLKLKNIPILFVLALIATGVWAYITYNTLVVNQRTTIETTVLPPEMKQPPVASSIEYEDPAADDATSPPAPELPTVPEPAQRVPGTTLNDDVLNDLGLDEPLVEEQIFYATAVPNDTIYPQWYTTVIDAPTAWDTSTGSTSTLVAVIDTGFALDHEDLSAAWFTNTAEQGTTASGDTCWTGTPADKQTNSCDDDSNGYIDDYRGWDFANSDNSSQAGDNYAPGANHGTKTSGLVGARSNNSLGVASVNWGTQILPLQGLYDQGYGYSTDLAAAIHYAVDMGADVINMSLGGPLPDSYTRAAVKYAQQNNVIIVASSGNCGLNQTDPQCVGYASPGGMGYPARYPETIAVGATTSTDTRASFSSWGPEIDIVAPGSGTIQTPSWSTSNATSLYATSSYGTSFSAPIVAGAVGVIKGEYPDITSDEIVALFSNSSDKVAGMAASNWTQEYGFGRLNVNLLLSELATYQQQLLKGGGQISQQNSSTTPMISTNTGHTSGTGITGSTAVKTYCVTDPHTLCSLKLSKQGSATVVNFTALRANNQGMVVFEWSKSDASTGTWDATVTANSKTSNIEKLIIL